ncbi:OmpP1/FadL family transporter [Thiosocius teredinicola]|uniref:OmpP1/FadL family transporter n=1 Tax=Thiosocius teredinicola TaxID=1973002 RepID=UPI000990CF44
MTIKQHQSPHTIGRNFRLIAGILALAACAKPANATDVFRFEGFGAISRGMGGVATAYDTGLSGMMTNPATLSLMETGSEIQLGFDFVSTDIEVKNKATGEHVSSDSHGNNRHPYFAPQIAYGRQIGSLTLGAGVFAQGGLGTEYGRDSFLSRASGNLDTELGNSSRLLVLNIPLAASYKVSESLTLGAGVDATWQGLNLDLLLGADQVGSLMGAGRVSGSLVPVLGGLPDLRGAHFSLTRNSPIKSGVSAWGHTARVGMTYAFSEDTRVGVAYTAKSRVADMEGRATLTAIDGVAGQIALPGDITIRDFQMPAVLNLGLSQRVSDKLDVAVDVSRVYWSDVMKDIKVGFVSDSGGDINILLPQDYRDQTVLAVGAAYRASDKWTLRGGFRIAQQALRGSTLFAVVPAVPKKHVSLGAGYAFSERASLDFAWSHAFEEQMDNEGTPNTSAPIRVNHSQDNVTLVYSYRF